jgi:hypothetical protein
MALLKKLLTGLIVTTILIILVFGYFGFVPGVSNLMGANIPIDLGVMPTTTDLASVNSKLGVTYSTLPASAIGKASLSETGSRQINVQLTSEEVTALINDHSSRWKYYPIEDVQVRINTDNTVELSGVLRVDRWSGYADAIGLNEETRGQVRPFLSYVVTNPSVYMKGSISLGGYAQIDLTDTQIGRISLPRDQINNYAGTLEYFAYEVSHLYQLQISQMSVQGGSLLVAGSIPTNVALSPPAEEETDYEGRFWVPSPTNAIQAFFSVTLVYIVGHLLRKQLSVISEKLWSILPSGVQVWIENYISSKSEIALEANKGSTFKLTKVEIIAYGIALTMMTLAFAYSSVGTLEELVVAIPTILGTSIMIEFIKNYLLTVFARSRGAWTEYRIWPLGLLMFLLSSFVFKTPFSSPSKSAQSEGEAADRISGLIAVNSVLLVLVLAGGFYYLDIQGISEIGKIGLGMCLLSAFFDSIPIPPLNGKDVWDWNKIVSIILLIVTFGINLIWLMLI